MLQNSHQAIDTVLSDLGVGLSGTILDNLPEDRQTILLVLNLGYSLRLSQVLSDVVDDLKLSLLDHIFEGV